MPAAIGKVDPPMVIEPGAPAVAAVKAVTTPQILTVVLPVAVTELGRMICPRALRVAVRHRLAPTVARPCPVKVVPIAIGKVVPPMVIEPGAPAVAAVKAVTTPQIFIDELALAATEPGGTICPTALRVAVRHRLAPTVISPWPFRVVPGAIG